MRLMPVAAPLRTPITATLLDYVQWRDTADPHWQAGVSYESICGGASTTIDYCVISGTGDANPTKTVTAEKEFRGATPFTVYTRIDCSPVGFWDDAEALISQQLQLAEPWRVEQVFFTGDAAGLDEVVRPHLAEDTESFYAFDPMIQLQTAATIAVTGTVDIVEGLAALEQYIGDCYLAQGIIHAPIAAFEAMVANYLVRNVSGRWQTYKGNLVVPGYGYPGTAPDGSAPGAGTTWLYVTGAIIGYRTPIKQVADRASSLNRSVNTLEMIVERTYVLGWDCCHGAVNVSTGGVITGTAGAAT